MTPHDDFRALLAGLDAPADPDPLFRRRLRARFVAEASGQVAAPRRLPEPAQPEPIRRNRLLDLVAAAILLLSMIGGLIGVERGAIGDPTPTVQAATATPTEIPAQPMGTLAEHHNNGLPVLIGTGQDFSGAGTTGD
jgi:hypothetical protein